MSVKIMGEVWECELPANQLHVLLSLADHADHVGENVFPTIALTAWKTGYSCSQVQRIIKELTKAKILVKQERHGRAVKYKIDLSAAPHKKPYDSQAAYLERKQKRLEKSLKTRSSKMTDQMRSSKMLDQNSQNATSDHSSPGTNLQYNHQEPSNNHESTKPSAFERYKTPIKVPKKSLPKPTPKPENHTTSKQDLIFEWICGSVLCVSLEDVKANKHLRGRANVLTMTIKSAIQVRSPHPDKRPTLEECNAFAPKLPGMKTFWTKNNPGLSFPTGNGTFSTFNSQWFEAGCIDASPVPLQKFGAFDYDPNCKLGCDAGTLTIIDQDGNRTSDYCPCKIKWYADHGIELKRGIK